MAASAQAPGMRSPTVRPPRHTSSKYDFVKVRVWLGDNSDHYYVLSRFLVSRMLTVTRIPSVVAIKIALELKKLLVDASLLDVSQADLEANLFKLMERRGYGAEYVSRYRMMTRFHQERVPLIVLVCGTACVGKSMLATQLSQRLNLPNVLQTDMVYELLRSAEDAPVGPLPIWAQAFATEGELMTAFSRECRIVRKGLDGDLAKAVRDGKPIIIEGMHLDPSIYLRSADAGGLGALPDAPPPPAAPAPAPAPAGAGTGAGSLGGAGVEHCKSTPAAPASVPPTPALEFGAGAGAAAAATPAPAPVPAPAPKHAAAPEAGGLLEEQPRPYAPSERNRSPPPSRAGELPSGAPEDSPSSPSPPSVHGCGCGSGASDSEQHRGHGDGGCEAAPSGEHRGVREPACAGSPRDEKCHCSCHGALEDESCRRQVAFRSARCAGGGGAEAGAGATAAAATRWEGEVKGVGEQGELGSKRPGSAIARAAREGGSGGGSGGGGGDGSGGARFLLGESKEEDASDADASSGVRDSSLSASGSGRGRGVRVYGPHPHPHSDVPGSKQAAAAAGALGGGASKLEKALAGGKSKPIVMLLSDWMACRAADLKETIECIERGLQDSLAKDSS
eukprot:jgi/Mesen1/7102/ME000369S06424